MNLLNIKKLAAALTVACSFVFASTASAAFISITTGNPGNAGTDNVLFNAPDTVKSGSYVDGNFNGAGAGFIVRFTSASGNGQIQGSGGQATITGLAGNNPFTSLTFGLLDDATFTKAILNPDANANGTIDFSVSYILESGSPYTEQFSLKGNGQNFFGIEAMGAARITSVTFSTADSSFADASQFRLGGFARKHTQQVPDSASTSLLVLIGLASIAMFRRK